MPDPHQIPKISADVLRRMDEEFATGEWAKQPAPVLRDVEDPFGMNFAWLEPNANPSPFDRAYEDAWRLTTEEGETRIAKTLRRVALGGTLAGGTDHDLIVSWVRESFPAKCLAAGDAGNDLLFQLATPEFNLHYQTRRVAEFLADDPDFQSLDLADQVLIASAIVVHHQADRA